MPERVARIITGDFVTNEMTGTACLHKGNEKMFRHQQRSVNLIVKFTTSEAYQLQHGKS